MKKYINLFLIFLSLSYFSCEKFLEPLPEDGRLTIDQLLFNPAYTEGLLMKAYSALPNNYSFESDVASDDAVSNLIDSPFTRMATGEWKASNYPISKWVYAYEQIYYINLFLEKYQSVKWASDPRLTQADLDRKNKLHLKRLKGEAHGLRAWYEYQLMQYHSGITSDGRLLGFAIMTKPLKINDDWKLPRNTFAECVNAILTDLDTAIANLPLVYADGTDQIVNETTGARFENRISGYAAKALKSRVALLAASPSFSASNVVTWDQAAAIAGSFLSQLGTLYNNGAVFYKEIRNKEILWNRSQQQIRIWEQDNFPPSLFGSGRTNPTQNLVDAFPMKNGYPITHASSSYKADNPYYNRDPRLANYIIYNGAKLKNQPIDTYVGANLNGINNLVTSTRTGYYLKKFMSESVNLTPGSTANSAHTFTLCRMTEVLLNFAEAANEAWGPDGDPNGYGFTAKTKINELRSRAGITQPDAYLASVTNKDAFRDLVRNERRIELCFEEFRFWDIRRWGQVSVMTAPIKGVYIDQVTGVDTTYSYSTIEERKFTSDMIYGPIPYDESMKYNIDQNKGW